MGQARAESGMWRLPGSHGLSPESHTQRRNAGVGRKVHPGVSFTQDLHHVKKLWEILGRADPAQARPGQAEAGILREIMRVSKTGPVADPRA